MYKRLLQGYIISLPFVSAFALSGTVTISLLLSVVMFILTIRKILLEQPCFSFPINYIVFISFLFWATVVLSYSFNSFGFPKSTNHLLAYSTFIFLFLLTPTLYLFVFRKYLEPQFILKTIFQTVFLCTLFTIIEFIIKNSLGTDINEFLPRPTLREFDAFALGLFQRARGFAEEPGHFALFLEIFSPVSIYYLFLSGYSQSKPWIKVVCVLIIYTAWLLTVSSAGFICFPAAIVITLLLNSTVIKRKPKILLKYLGTSFLIVITFLILLNLFFPVFDLIWLSIFEKSGSASLDDRADRVTFFNTYFFSGSPLNLLFGYGPAGYSNLGFDDTRSIVSFYLSLIFEIGIAGFISIIVFLLFIVLISYKIDVKQRLFFQAALFTGLLHYLFIANYWFPWLWFLTAVIIFLSIKKSDIYNDVA